MGKRGTKFRIIDWQKVDAMCKIQCTGEEIASVLDMDYDTLASACKRENKMKLSDYMQQKRLGGRASLRRNQWKAAENLNPTMLIWLGKQYLNQADSPKEDDKEIPESYTVVIERKDCSVPK